MPKPNNLVAELELKVHGQFFCTESRGNKSSLSRLGAGLVDAAAAAIHRSGCTVQRNNLTTLTDEGRSNIHEIFLINVLVGGGAPYEKGPENHHFSHPLIFFLFGD